MLNSSGLTEIAMNQLSLSLSSHQKIARLSFQAGAGRDFDPSDFVRQAQHLPYQIRECVLVAGDFAHYYFDGVLGLIRRDNEENLGMRKRLDII